MRHEMLTQRAPFCIGAMAKKGTLSQHFMTHVVPPLSLYSNTEWCVSVAMSQPGIAHKRAIITFNDDIIYYVIMGVPKASL